MLKIFLVLLIVVLLTSCELFIPPEPSDEVLYLDGQLVMSLAGCLYVGERAGDTVSLKRITNFTCELESKFTGGVITDRTQCPFMLSPKTVGSDYFYAKLIKGTGCRLVKPTKVTPI